MAWRWRIETAEGAAVPFDFELPEFSAQGDAESWLGEVWQDLAEAGGQQATLLDDDHVVYGPMSLAAE